MTNVYTAEQGCKSSRADAKHDFHSIFNPDKLQGYVTSNIPNITISACDTALQEDPFIDDQLLKEAAKSNDNKSDPQYVLKQLNENIGSRYIAKYIERPQHKFDAPYDKSLLQEYFIEKNILDDIFFVCDVAYANVREDLKFASSELQQTFYWVQNAQTLYDPAGKTSWHSDKSYFDLSEPVITESLGGGAKDKAGVKPGRFDIGVYPQEASKIAQTGAPAAESSESSALEPPAESSIAPLKTASKSKASSKSRTSSPASSPLKSESPNYFKKDGSRFAFCWQNAVEDKIIPYPIWPGTTTEYSYSFSEDVPEQMLYTNKNLYLGIRSEDVRDYSTHEAYLIITDPTKPRYFGFSDKVLSAKGSGILKGADLASYRAKGYDLKRFVKFVDTQTNTPDEKKLFLDEVMDYSPELQVLSKKTGDASQSLSCCKKKFNLQRFENNSLGLAGNVINFVSNGNHAFVSFDRIAWACALNYNCPIVIANTQNGFTVYIRNDLLNVHNQIDNFFQIVTTEAATTEAANPKYKMLEPFKDTDGNFVIEKYYTDAPNLVTEVKTAIDEAFKNINIDIDYKNDLTYQNFLLAHFLEINTFNLFLNLENSVLNFTPEFYNTKITKLYQEKIILVKDEFTKITTPFDDVKYSLDGKKSINEIMTSIDTNIADIVTNIKGIYEGVEPDVKIENKNKENLKYKSIIIALKYLQEIITGINEIQKKLALNIDSMKSLIEYQREGVGEIGALTPAALAMNLKKLPKGVASNILTCTPYNYCVTNSKPARSTDIFFERSTSIFGTTIVILQIYNTLNNNTFKPVRDMFMDKLYKLLEELVENGKDNLSFVGIVNVAKSYLENTLMAPPTEGSVLAIDAIIAELFAPVAEEEETVAATDAKEEETVAAPLKEEETSAATDAKEEETLATAKEEETVATTDTKEEIYVAPPPTEEDKQRMRAIFNQKRLFVPKEFKSDRGLSARLTEIQNVTSMIASLFGSNPDKTILTEIKNAYETDMFIKGFIGIFMFLRYTATMEETEENEKTRKSKKSKVKIPVVLTIHNRPDEDKLDINPDKARERETQDNMLKRLFQALYLDFGVVKADPSNIQIMDKEIKFMMDAQFNFDAYNSAQDKKVYVKAHLKRSTRQNTTDAFIDNMISQITNIIDYRNNVTEITADYDANMADISDSIFTTNSFTKLLEMNVVTFGDKPLTGKFEGIDGNEINVNMALLYFVENRFSSMNKKPVPHPELIGLFSQLFKEKGFHSSEFLQPDPNINTNEKAGGGGDDDVFSVMQNLFVSDTPESTALFNQYRRNSYLLLNLPTTYEIVTNSFGSYPTEIMLYLQNLNKQYIQEQAGKESQQKFTEVFGSNKSPITGQPPASYDMGRGFDRPAAQALKVGGKTRKNKRKIMPKRKSMRDKKSKNGRNKTKKIKREHKRNKHSRRFKTQ
jgi:hypothetical protein